VTEQEKLSKILDICKTYIGLKENPPNSNNVIFNTRFYGHEVNDLIDKTKTHPWCGTSVSEIYQEALCPLGVIDYRRGFAGVPYAINNISKWGKFVSAKDAKPGYIVFYKFKNAKGVYEWAHTGILGSYIVENKFDAFEGNTGVGNDSNGGEFMDRYRTYSPDLVLIARPNCLDK